MKFNMSENNEFDEGNKAARKMLYCLLFALLPFLLIVLIYIQHQTSGIFNDIAFKTIELPAIHSSKSPVLSRVMDLYVKTSPALAFIAFLITRKHLRLKKGKSFSQAITVHVLFTFLYALLIYVFLFTNTELTTSAKLLAFMSKNDFYLTFFYVSLYSGIYIFSYLYMWFCIGTYRLFKERW